MTKMKSGKRVKQTILKRKFNSAFYTVLEHQAKNFLHRHLEQMIVEPNAFVDRDRVGSRVKEDIYFATGCKRALLRPCLKFNFRFA